MSYHTTGTIMSPYIHLYHTYIVYTCIYIYISHRLFWQTGCGKKCEYDAHTRTHFTCTCICIMYMYMCMYM